MITDTQFAQVEKEAYASFKALMPRLVDEAVESAFKHQRQSIDWINAVESDSTVWYYSNRLLEIAQLKLLKRQLGTQIPHMLYRDYFRCV